MARTELARRAHEVLSASRALIAESTRLVDSVRTDRRERHLASQRRAATLARAAAVRRERPARPGPDPLHRTSERLRAAAALSEAVRAEALALRLRARAHVRHAAELVRRAAKLTSREEEVLALVAHGYTNAAIAAKLDIAENTVASYRRRGMDKIGAGRVSELVGWASEAGLFPDPDV